MREHRRRARALALAWGRRMQARAAARGRAAEWPAGWAASVVQACSARTGVCPPLRVPPGCPPSPRRPAAKCAPTQSAACGGKSASCRRSSPSRGSRRCGGAGGGALQAAARHPQRRALCRSGRAACRLWRAPCAWTHARRPSYPRAPRLHAPRSAQFARNYAAALDTYMGFSKDGVGMDLTTVRWRPLRRPCTGSREGEEGERGRGGGCVHAAARAAAAWAAAAWAAAARTAAAWAAAR